jgi:hypothetical protein
MQLFAQMSAEDSLSSGKANALKGIRKPVQPEKKQISRKK